MNPFLRFNCQYVTVADKPAPRFNRTVNRKLQPLKAIFDELFADGLIASNPANRLGKFKKNGLRLLILFQMRRLSSA